MEEKRRVGILGGTFDPIHNAHLQLGREARKAFGLDAIWFMPTGNSYFKTRQGRRVTDAADRAAMVRLAVARGARAFAAPSGKSAARGKPILRTPWRSWRLLTRTRNSISLWGPIPSMAWIPGTSQRPFSGMR